MIACWFVAVLELLGGGYLLRGRVLLVWVWTLYGDGDGWRGVGSCRSDWGCWVAGRLRATLERVVCGARPINLCRGLPIARRLEAVPWKP